MECEQCQKETGVLNTDVSTVDEIMLQDILIPVRHFFCFLLWTEQFRATIITIFTG